MNKYKKWFVSLGITLMLISTVLLLGNRTHITEDFTESIDFRSILLDYKSQLSYFEMNRLPKEEAIKQLTVTDQEVSEYRNYYGSLSEQISNIKEQYNDDIQEAKDLEAKKVEKNLLAERNEKIEDITKNFEDNKYVKTKILNNKKVQLELYYDEMETNIRLLEQQYPYFSYELKNTATGETKTKGDLVNQKFFKESYNSATNGAFYDVEERDDLAYSVSNNLNNDADSEMYSESATFSYDVPVTDDVFIGTISISDLAVKGTEIEDKRNKHDYMKQFNIGLSVVSLILGIITLITLWRNRKSYKTYELPIEIQLAILFFTLLASFIAALFISDSIYQMFNFGLNNDPFYSFMIIIFPIVIWFMMNIAIQFMMSIVYKIRNGQRTWNESVFNKIIVGISNLFLSLSLTFKILCYLVVIFLAGFGFAVVFQNAESGAILIIYLILFLLFVVPTSLYFFKQLGDLNKVLSVTEDIVAFSSDAKINLGERALFKKHADHINKMQVGVENSQFEQNKSERLKTELITNVSHDLRTPLTSIITYTELLKTDNLSAEEKEQYVDVIDKKSQRLKVLIDDLFEVSKMATGNVELNRQNVDMTQLLQQALGEHESDIEKSNLRFQITVPNQALIASIDGQKYWRAIDNLISNSIKYAMEGTRVFVTLEEVGSQIQLTIKNISKYEISEDVEELYERFKRADASRYTEGSGLGLAIAQSIIELHGGQIKISIDGDLFKVVITQSKI